MFNMKIKIKKNIIVLSIVVIICVVFFLLFNYFKNKNSEKIQKFNDFDITVRSYLDCMPPLPPNEEADFSFYFNGINEDSCFFNNYEIESIKLNGKKIDINKITISEDNKGFWFYSKNYKNNNTINMIIRNKITNRKKKKKITVSTSRVF